MRRSTILFLALLIAGFTTSVACSAPSAELYDGEIADVLNADGDNEGASFDHSDFEKLLARHVDADTNRVRYADLKTDSESLDAYLETIANAELETLGPDEQHALLINAYNAYTLQLILEHYPGIDSIRDISDPWGNERYVVAGYPLSLDQIEHQLIRPIFKDPRIHFAVNCAAIDCPPLRPWAYRGDSLDEQLDEVTHDVLSASDFVRVEGDELQVTRLFDWYEDDFINDSFHGHAANVAQYIVRYSTEDVRRFVESHDGEPSVSFLDYDWGLNDVE